MVWNNWSYTKRKQKEMTQKSIAYQEKPNNDTYQYTMYRKPSTNSHAWKQEKERQRRVKLMSIALIAIQCIVSIGIIVYFYVYGV